MNDEALAEGSLRALPGGDEALERIEHLEAWWGRRASLAKGAAPDGGAAIDVDVVLLGGGLWLVLAPYLARRGLTVAVVDRGVIGRGHREWNISGPELESLVKSGLFTRDEIDALVVARYRQGICRWHEGGTWPVHGLLDHAVDGEAFLKSLREKAEAAGVRLFDRHAVTSVTPGRGGVEIVAGRLTLVARIAVDALGAASPHARVDLGCPTVGGVLRGLPEGDAPHEITPDVGDVLVTIDHRDAGRQHVWEGFPGRRGDFTAYLFHYARARSLGPRPLLSLYGRFFRERPRYKRGEAEIARLTYGIIPGWTRLTPAPVVPDRLLLVGDAAARHSPLTFCGFGSMVRSFAAIGDGVVAALACGDFSSRRLSSLCPEPELLRGVGGLALLLAEANRPEPADATNRLLDAAFRSLFEAGDRAYGRFLRDEATLVELAAFMWATSKKRPSVARDIVAHLGAREVARWAKVAMGA